MKKESSKREAIELINKAYNLVEEGKLKKAKRLLESGLDICDEIADGHNELGVVYCLLGDFLPAYHHALRAIELDPTNPKYHNSLAFALMSMGRIDDALVSARCAIELDPNYASAHNLVSKILKMKGVPEEASYHEGKARKIYARTGMRSNGHNLKEGDLERFFTKRETIKKMKKIPKLLEEVLNDEDFRTAIRKDMRKTHLVDYKQMWRLGVITPDIDIVVLRRGDVHFDSIVDKARHFGQIPLKKKAILYKPTFLGTPQNITITGGDIKSPTPVYPLWSYIFDTKIKKGESTSIRDIKVRGMSLPEFLKKQEFPLKESYDDGDPLTTERGGIIVDDRGTLTIFHPSYFVQRSLIDDEGNLIYLGLDEGTDKRTNFAVEMKPSVNPKLAKEISSRGYKPILRYHSFPYKSDMMLPIIDTPRSSSKWSDLVIDPRGKARLFVAKDKKLDEWDEMMNKLKDLFIEEVAKKEYHLLELTKDEAHLKEYLSKKEVILRDYFIIEDLGSF